METDGFMEVVLTYNEWNIVKDERRHDYYIFSDNQVNEYAICVEAEFLESKYGSDAKKEAFKYFVEKFVKNKNDFKKIILYKN